MFNDFKKLKLTEDLSVATAKNSFWGNANIEWQLLKSSALASQYLS